MTPTARIRLVTTRSPGPPAAGGIVPRLWPPRRRAVPRLDPLSLPEVLRARLPKPAQGAGGARVGEGRPDQAATRWERRLRRSGSGEAQGHAPPDPRAAVPR